MDDITNKYVHDLINKVMAIDSRLKLAQIKNDLDLVKKDIDKVIELNQVTTNLIQNLKEHIEKQTTL